jgi:hypothetical protein
MLKPKLLEQVRIVARLNHMSIRTETAYQHWIKRKFLVTDLDVKINYQKLTEDVPPNDCFSLFFITAQNVIYIPESDNLMLYKRGVINAFRHHWNDNFS